MAKIFFYNLYKPAVSISA